MTAPNPIPSLRANVSRDDALQHFTTGASALAARIIQGPARSIAPLYVPYRLFTVTILNRGRQQIHLYALDQVEGTLDLFQFPTPPTPEPITTRNFLPPQLPPDRSRDLLIHKVRRLVFSRGFMRLSNLQFEAAPLADFYIPYWLCFRGSGPTAKLQILDAVRRRPEGAKLRHMVEAWLRSQPETPVS